MPLSDDSGRIGTKIGGVRADLGQRHRLPVRDRHDDWLIVWERDADEPDIIRVRYIGVDPFA